MAPGLIPGQGAEIPQTMWCRKKKGERERKQALLCRNHTLCDLWGGDMRLASLSKAAVLHSQVFSKSVTVSKSESLKDEVALSVLIWYMALFVYFKFSNVQQHFFFFCFWPYHQAYRILVPQPGLKPIPPAVEGYSPHHWTTRELLLRKKLRKTYMQLLEHAESLKGCLGTWWHLPHPGREAEGLRAEAGLVTHPFEIWTMQRN